MSRQDDINAALALIDEARQNNEIRERLLCGGEWRRPTRDSIVMNGDYEYCAAPEPIEFWINVYPNRKAGAVWSSKSSADRAAEEKERSALIHIRQTGDGWEIVYD